MPRMSKVRPTAEEIAEMASRGEDISAYFTNRFTVVRPVRRVVKAAGRACPARGEGGNKTATW
jgi:hypothetical protein